MTFLADVLGVAGFASLMAGLVMTVGAGGALIAGGILLMAVSLFAHWMRSR
jgi:hypothetical protein